MKIGLTGISCHRMHPGMAPSDHENAMKADFDRWTFSYDDHDRSTWLDEPFLLIDLRLHPVALRADEISVTLNGQPHLFSQLSSGSC
jgi:hypothetical protein